MKQSTGALIACGTAASLAVVRFVMLRRKYARWLWADAVVVALRSTGDRGTAPVLEFSTASGRRIRADSRISTSGINHAPDTRIRIRYDPSNPSNIAISGWESYFSVIWFLGVGLLCAFGAWIAAQNELARGF